MMLDAGRLDDFPSPSITVVSDGRRDIGVVRWDGKLYAILNVCPHAQAPVCEGALTPRLFSRTPGRLEVAEERGTLICAWHRYEFDLETGLAEHRAQYRLKKYPITVREGRVMIDVPGPGRKTR